MWLLDDVVKAVNGRLLRRGRETFTGISTDSRTIQDGELFVPIVGASFDGHVFINEALEHSRGGTLCTQGSERLIGEGPSTVILVKNTVDALLSLARFKRERLSGTFIGITGSNGKTTTKEILVTMVQRKFSVHFNEKNYNNLIGVPMSILSIKNNPEVCIFELGTNKKGEIKKLARTTIPTESLITNINPSHLEGLNGLEVILEEKLDLFHHTQKGGRLFVNADDPYLTMRHTGLERTILTFGIDKRADFRLVVEEDLGWDGFQISITSSGDFIEAKTPLLGKHNLYNLLAATTIACAIGIDEGAIACAIEEFKPYDKRFRPMKTEKGYTVIDDSYNANPSSMQWAIQTLVALPSRGKKVAILGDMRELGEKSAGYHRALGAILKNADIPLIALFGEEVRETYYELGPGHATVFDDKKKLIEYVSVRLNPNDTVLVKGSRALQMEEIVEALK